MAHYTIELARACIAGYPVIGWYIDPVARKWRLVDAAVDEANLQWHYILGHKGSVTIHERRTWRMRREPLRKTFDIQELIALGWEPREDPGDGTDSQRERMENQRRENIAWMKRLSKKRGKR